MYIELTYWHENPDTGEIDIESGNYQITNLSFSPQVDLTGNSLPVNEYTCDVILPSPIPGTLSSATLYDDMDQRWCSFPITGANQITSKCLRLTCSSWLKRLDDRQLAEVVYVNESAANAIDECFGTAYANDYTIATAIASKTVSGYAPAQTGRERLTWLCFVLGAYVEDIYREDALITEVDETETLIPIDKTYGGSQRPTVDNGEWVTGLKITTYTFRQGTQEEWEDDDNSYMFPTPWIATPQTIELSNTNAPADARANVVELDSIYLINPNNVSDITARLAKYWFNPLTVQASVINNRSYKPGDLVTVYTTQNSMVTGYIQQAAFSFGKQAMSKLSLIGAEAVEGAKLTINYTYQSGIIGKQTYYLPVGVTFTIQNNYIDRIYQDRRYIYRPQSGTVTGTMVDGGLTINQPCDVVLEYRDERLYVYSVDSIVKQESSGTYTGVIS